jgi:hypothetical protein
LFSDIVIAFIFAGSLPLLKTAFEKLYPYDLPETPPKRIRISYAYLIRIYVNGYYLLVKSTKVNRFVPPGGAYHFENDFDGKALEFERDESYGDKKDIRGTIPYDQLRNFLRWTKTQKNREVGANREYQEELIESSVLPGNLFSKAQFSYVKREYKGIRYSPHNGNYELIIFDIFELQLSDQQHSYLQSLIGNNEQNELFILATRQDILYEGVSPNQPVATIGDHSYAILRESDRVVR